MQENPFIDLVPENNRETYQSIINQSASKDNPFAHLIPEKNVPRETQNAQAPKSFLQNYFGNRKSELTGDWQNAKELGAAAISGLGKISNIPSNIAPNLFYRPYSTENMTDQTQRLRGDSDKKMGREDINFYDKFGTQKGLKGMLAEELIGFLPFNRAGKLVEGAVKGTPLVKALAGNTASGAAYGATNADPENRLWGGLAGGALGAGATGLGALGETALKYGAKKIAQSSIPGLIEKAGEKIRGYINPEESSGLLSKRYRAASAKNTENWRAAEEGAKKLDSSPSDGFDSSHYKENIKKFINKVKGMEPALKEQYKNAAEFARGAYGLAPQSFEGAMAVRKNLNQQIRDFENKNNVKIPDKQKNDLIKNIKDSLLQTVKNNESKANPVDYKNFSEAWEKANQSHRDLQEFYKAPNTAEGLIKPIRQRRELLQSGSPLDASIMNKYMPKPSQTGIGGLKQLEKILGSKEDAKKAASAYFMRQVTDGNTRDAALRMYAKLSPQQREYMFGGTPEGKILKAAHEVQKAFGQEKAWMPYLHHGIVGASTLAPLGFLLGEEEGGYKEGITGGLLGLVLGAAGAKGAQKLSPEIIKKITQYAQKPMKEGKGNLINYMAQPAITGG